MPSGRWARAAGLTGRRLEQMFSQVHKGPRTRILSYVEAEPVGRWPLQPQGRRRALYGVQEPVRPTHGGGNKDRKRGTGLCASFEAIGAGQGCLYGNHGRTHGHPICRGRKATLTASLLTNVAFTNNACALMLWFWLDLLYSPRQLAGLDGACGRVGEREVGSLLSTAFFGDSLRKKLPMQIPQFLLPDQLVLSDCWQS